MLNHKEPLDSAFDVENQSQIHQLNKSQDFQHRTKAFTQTRQLDLASPNQIDTRYTPIRSS